MLVFVHEFVKLGPHQGTQTLFKNSGTTYGNIIELFRRLAAGKIGLPAVALALKSMLGLTCDPVCGLVEVPCIKRNVSGAVNAITAAQMTMAGIKSVIPADEVIDSMRRIGNDMPVCLKETGEGGLAITPTAKVYKQKLNNIDN